MKVAGRLTTRATRARQERMPAPTSDRDATLREIASLPTHEVLTRLDSSLDGLADIAVTLRRSHVGPNVIAQERPPRWYQQLAHAFLNPFIGVLVILAVISLLTDDKPAAAIITVMVVLSALLRFVQENRSQRAAQALQALVRTRATVRRAGAAPTSTASAGHRVPTDSGPIPSVVAGHVELPLEELVPGDIVHLSAGDMVPADVRLLASKDLYINQSALTGESIPVEKHALAIIPADDPPRGVVELPTLAFLGTSVVSGTASALVVSTGGRTHLGALASTLTRDRRGQTAFDRGVASVSWLLIRFMLAMVPVVFLLNGVLKGDWLEALLFGLAVAVGLTPEMLPMIVSANLAKGAVVMSKRRTIVKRLDAIQNVGAMDVLCCDKTGTLTQDRVVLEVHVDPSGTEDESVLALAWLNSANQTGLRNLLDTAILEHASAHQPPLIDPGVRKIDEVPWDYARRRMSVVVERDGGQHQLICKGAVDEILDASVSMRSPGGVIPVSPDTRANALAVAARMNARGLRLVAVATREFSGERTEYSVADEAELTFAGFIGFLDPPKESAAGAVQALTSHGVRLKVLTGDNELVTRKVCRDVGIDATEVALGPDLGALDDEALGALTDRVHVFARLSPDDKARVVRVLRSRGHTVGFLGDGINDAPALRAADVGISVDTAADIARETADVILLEKNLQVLEVAVIEGRRTFGNIMKYLKMTASSNFGNVFSILVASAFLPFLPMLPIQLLTQNLLYDISQISIPWDSVDDEYLAQPRRWDAGDIGRFMIAIGPISSIFDIATFLVMWYVFQANAPEHQALFHSGWFVVGLLTQSLIVHMIRTEKVPFVQSIASPPVLVLTATIMAIGVLVPFSALGAAIGLVPLPWSYFPWLAGILACYAALTQFMKVMYIRRFGRWL
jgi:Mg2+-importing ATPase